MSGPSALRRLGAGLLWLALSAVAARAQEAPDSLRLPGTPDSAAVAVRDSVAAAPSDSVAARVPKGPPLAFLDAVPGRVLVDTVLARLPVLDVPGLLKEIPGSFFYEFGTPGWPDAWSPHGLRPEQVALLFNGLSLNDLMTGRPRYEFLPLTALQPPRLGAGPYGGALAVLTGLRPYAEERPITEIRYWSGANSFQSIEAVHAQRRPVSMFGRRVTVRLLGSYGGRAAEGDYPGSRLRRERRLTGRIRFASPSWSVEVLDLYNRHRVGAHGGVVAAPGASIFQRTGAGVVNEGAQRQTIRNDLSLTLRGNALGMFAEPGVVSVFWTAQTSRYTGRPVTVGLRSDRLVVRMDQTLPGASPPSAQLAVWMDAARPEAGAVDVYPARVQAHTFLRDTLAAFSGRFAWQGGAHVDGGRIYPDVAGDLEGPLGRWRAFVRGRVAGQQVSIADRYGFGGYLGGIGEADPGLVFDAEAGLHPRGGTITLGATLFAGQTARALDAYLVQADTAQAFLSDAPVRRAGLTVETGWRRASERGLYATLYTTLLYVTGGGHSEAPTSRAESLPLVSGSGRLGLRLLLFQGDLDLDAYLDGRFWSALRSRTLHPPTGLLVLRPANAEPVGPSGVLDVVIQAGVRTATLFVAWDNVLASSTGAGLYEGTLLVPSYPLPERRFRFGVYWPIQD